MNGCEEVTESEGEKDDESLASYLDEEKWNKKLEGWDEEYKRKWKYLDKIVTYQFNFYQFDISICNAVALILLSYQEKHTQGHKRTIALGFELQGGFILHGLNNSGVLAAAVVEMITVSARTPPITTTVQLSTTTCRSMNI